jgi:hypothetical protein
MQAPNPLIERATAELKQLGLDVDAIAPPANAPLYLADAWLGVGNGAALVDYAVNAKSRLTPATLGAATMQLQHAAATTGHPVLLVTEYLTPPMAKKLREQKQQFVDAAGNIYLEGPGLLVYVTGRKQQADHLLPHAGKAHTMTGLKVTFALLCDPLLADAPHRTIAATAGVALGAVPAVLADLQQTGDLLVFAKRRRLNATKRLLDEWALAYARRLRAKTLQAIYLVKDFGTWPQWQLDAPALWGGEPAANLLVQYLRPGVLTIYADKLPPTLQARHAMRKVGLAEANTNGAVLEWRKPFWGAHPAAARPDTVHPVLVYADLLATGDARCIETAKLVYDEHLARLLPAA